ncbi:MAG: thiamine pyrophosphate-dependent enzyme, partial [Pararhodobacter sp.]
RAIPSEVAPALIALEAALAAHEPGQGVAARHATHAQRNAEARKAVLAAAQPDSAEGMTKAQVALALSQALEGHDASVLSELGCPMAPMALTHHRAWYQEPHAGGLGWSFPAAMGMQLASPGRLIVATMGDGSYMFSNPVACHQIAEALALPVLIIVLNNAEWGAVRHSVSGLYPQGHAVRANQMPLTGLSPSPDFTLIAQASRALGLKATTAEEFAATLAQALEHVTARKGAALIDVTVRRD